MMRRIAGPLLAFVLALANVPANAQAGATPAMPDQSTASELRGRWAQVPTVDDVCRALEQSAAENALPVEFFARVIWQESRFDARAVSPKGAAGIAQFMPATASWHGLADPFEPVEALRHSAAYLRELLDRFGNLGLAAAAYNAGPGRVSAWLTNYRSLPTRNYVTPSPLKFFDRSSISKSTEMNVATEAGDRFRPAMYSVSRWKSVLSSP